MRIDPMKPNEFAGLAAHEMDRLLFAIDASLKVQRRFQFYLWSQGGLQGFLPHETLICAWGDIHAARYRYEIFSRSVHDSSSVKGLGDPVDGLLGRLIREWKRRGEIPCWIDVDEDPGTEAADGGQVSWTGEVLAHGTRELRGDSGSFFAFVNVPRAADDREPYLAELLLPYLHMAVHRMAMVPEQPASEVDAAAVLTEREIQVLQWIHDGKRNMEIGGILGISPLTVKNHVRKILQKLRVTNRAQAVSKALSLRLIQGGA